MDLFLERKRVIAIHHGACEVWQNSFIIFLQRFFSWERNTRTNSSFYKTLSIFPLSLQQALEFSIHVEKNLHFYFFWYSCFVFSLGVSARKNLVLFWLARYKETQKKKEVNFSVQNLVCTLKENKFSRKPKIHTFISNAYYFWKQKTNN